MRTFSLRVSLLAAIVLGVLVVGGSTSYANHSWGSYHWARTSNPFTLKLGDNMTTTAWKAALNTASTDWSADTGGNPLNTTVVTGSTNPKNCRAVAGTVQVCNSKYGGNGWLGLAQIWLSNGHIAQGTAKMNDTYFGQAKYNNPNEKLHVVCQEVGHTFGLGHTSEDGSSQNTCMDYYSNTGVNAGSTLSTKPNAHDYDQLAAIYAHLDSTTTVAAATAAGKSGFAPGKGGANGVDGHGTPGGASRERGDWYVEDLGNGVKLITHITWAQ